MTQITAGRIVLYRIHDYDLQGRTFTTGNAPRAGDIVPLIVVRVWENEFGDQPGVNGQLILDCPEGTLWVCSKGEGTENGKWFWPSKV
jgi:hypothetical protein